jgi:EmrB/QacA subfamily drug resistance transporter
MTTLQRWTLTAVCLATAMLMLDVAVVATALPDIAADLHADLHGLKWVIDAYTLALGGAVLTAGSLADRLGRRRLFVAGLVVFTLSSLACALAPSIGALIAARAVQGLGAAMMFAVSLALIADAFAPGRARAGALAAYGATIGASFAIGPLVGGALTTTLGWEWVFLLNIPLGLFGLAVALLRLRESRDPVPRAVDVPGQVTLVLALFGVVFGLLNAADGGWTAPATLGPLLVGLMLALAFVAIEARVREPMVPLGMFRQRHFAGAQVTAIAISAGLYAMLAYLMIYLQQVLGLSAVSAGLVLVPSTLLNLVTAAASAPLAGRVSPRTIIGVGLACATGGLLLMTSVGVDSSWWALMPGLCLGNIGAGLVNPAIGALSLQVPADRSGLASGIHDTARQSGLALGVAALGALIPVGAVGVDPTAFVGGIHDALWVGAAVTAAGALVATALLRERMRGLRRVYGDFGAT